MHLYDRPLISAYIIIAVLARVLQLLYETYPYTFDPFVPVPLCLSLLSCYDKSVCAYFIARRILIPIFWLFFFFVSISSTVFTPGFGGGRTVRMQLFTTHYFVTIFFQLNISVFLYSFDTINTIVDFIVFVFYCDQPSLVSDGTPVYHRSRLADTAAPLK